MTTQAYPILSSLLGLREDEMRRKGEQRGTLRERNGNWYIAFRQWTRDADGNLSWTRTERLVGASKGKDALSRRAAERKGYDEHVAPANAENAAPGGKVTLAEFWERRYLPDCEPLLSKAWRSSMRSLMSRHVLPTFGPMALASIDVRRVQMLLGSKLAAGLSTQTIEHIRKCLSTVLRHARRVGYIIGQLATEDVQTPTVRHKDKQALTIDQLRMLADAMPARWQALVLVLGRHGLRIGEAAALRWQDVNLTDQPVISDGELIRANSLLVRSSWNKGERRLPKSGKVRHIPLVAETWVAVMVHLERSKHTAPDSPVFPGWSGKPMDAHNVGRRSLKTAATTIGCPWVTWHTLRHTAATLADAAGLTVAEKQKILGHASPEMSAHYTHPEIERVRAAMEQATGVVQ